MYISDKFNDKVNYIARLNYLLFNEQASGEQIISAAIISSCSFANNFNQGSDYYMKELGCGNLKKINIDTQNELLLGFELSDSVHESLLKEITKFENENSNLKFSEEKYLYVSNWYQENSKASDSLIGSELSFSKEVYELLEKHQMLTEIQNGITSESRAYKYLNSVVDFHLFALANRYMGVQFYEIEPSGEFCFLDIR